MNKITNLDDLQSIINDNKLSLLYISRDNCSVCHALLPQVVELLEEFPTITSVHVDADEVPEIAGQYSIFTIPVVIVFVDGKEMIRKARFVPIKELQAELERLISLIDAE